MDVGGAAPELREHGAATIDVIDDFEHASRTLRMRDEVEASLDGRSTQISVEDLLADCPPGTLRIDPDLRQNYPRCRLARTAGSSIVLARPLHADTGSIVGFGVLGGAIGLGVCAFECNSPWSYASGATLIVMTGAVAALGVFLYAISHYD